MPTGINSCSRIKSEFMDAGDDDIMLSPNASTNNPPNDTNTIISGSNDPKASSGVGVDGDSDGGGTCDMAFGASRPNTDSLLARKKPC